MATVIRIRNNIPESIELVRQRRPDLFVRFLGALDHFAVKAEQAGWEKSRTHCMFTNDGTIKVGKARETNDYEFAHMLFLVDSNGQYVEDVDVIGFQINFNTGEFFDIVPVIVH